MSEEIKDGQNESVNESEESSRFVGEGLVEHLTSDARPKTKEGAEMIANDKGLNLDNLKYVDNPEAGEALYGLVSEYIDGMEEGDNDKKRTAAKTFASILDREFSRASDEGRIQY